jgi:hypothetical protein
MAAASVERPRETDWVIGLCMLAVLQTSGCASPTAARDAAHRPPKAITDFLTVETTATMTVIVKSDQPLTYTLTRQHDPQGVWLRFPETVLDGLQPAYRPPPNPVLRRIRTAEATGNPREVQIFLELAQEFPYEVLPGAEGLKIIFQKSIAKAPATAAPAETRGPPQPAEAAPAALSSVAPVMRDVRIEVRTDAVLIRVRAGRPVNVVKTFTLDEDPAKIVFDLIGLRSAYRGQQKVPVQSPWVRKVRHAGHPDKVRLVVETDKAHLNDFAVDPVPDGLVITVGPSAAAIRPEVQRGGGDPPSKKKQ